MPMKDVFVVAMISAGMFLPGQLPAAVTLSFSPTSVTGTATAAGTLALSSPASANTVFSLTSSRPDLVTVPEMATIYAGSSSTSFLAEAVISTETVLVSISAESTTLNTSAILTVNRCEPLAAPSLTSSADQVWIDEPGDEYFASTIWDTSQAVSGTHSHTGGVIDGGLPCPGPPGGPPNCPTLLHFFDFVDQPKSIAATDFLVTNIYISTCRPLPESIRITFTLERPFHRTAVAYWGALIDDGTEDQILSGPIPPAGSWHRFEMNVANFPGVGAGDVNGVVFESTGTGSQVWFDRTGTISGAVTLADLSPRVGGIGGGTVVRLFGTGFAANGTTVSFGSVQASSVTVLGSTQLLATAPPHAAGTVGVAVTSVGGTATLANAFTYLAPPTLTSIDPRKGKTAGGEAVTLVGTNFMANETTVSIGGAPATSVTVGASTSISATTPARSSGPTDVTVTTPAGSVTLAGGFTYFAPPTITSFSPTSGRVGDTVTIAGTNFDAEASGNQVTLGGVAASVTSASTTTLVISIPQNASSSPISVTTAGGTVTSGTAFTVITYVSITVSPASVSLDPNQTLQLTATATLAGGGTADVTAQAAWSSGNPSVATVTAGLVRGIATGSTTVSATFSGLQASAPVTVTNPEPVPPDPSTVASPIDRTVVPMFVDEIKFLYTGANPIQTGVAAGAIDDNRAATVRGRVTTLGGAALPAVQVTALGHPELGQTLTRADGKFDFVFNGGGKLALQFAKSNFISAQRSVFTTWGQQTTIDEMVLIGYDAQVTEIALGAAAEQVARGSVINDADGTRRATLLVPPGTTAVLALPNGTTQSVSTLHVRATEFTVGPNGPKAMPAALPPASGYTYCVELSADEAVATGATVRFSKALLFYTENFLGFAVGSIVPAGYYDRTVATWVPSDNGIVLKVVSVTGNLADIDLNGDGAPDPPTALASIGIDDAERQMLATLYAPGQSLWRVPVAHFTPWDANWPGAPQEVAPGEAVAPSQPQPYWIPAPSAQDSSGNVCHASAINCYSTTLSESIPIVGTPFSLDYESSRVALTQNSMTISLSGATIPASLKRIDLAITVAGEKQTFSFTPQPNLKHEFTWNGLDVFGRRVQGAREAGVLVSYVYDSIYARPVPGGRAWDRFSFQPTGVRGRTELSFNQAFTVRLGHFDVATAGFGTWTLSAQHFYDGRGGAIYDADGTQRSGDPNQTNQLALTSYAGHLITHTFSGDGGPALQAGLDSPNFIAVGPDNAVYLCDSPSGGGCKRIRKIDPNTTIINTIAGNGVSGFTPDGSLALGNPIGARHLAVGPDNTLYFLEAFRVRRIVDGLLTTVAGNGATPPFLFNPPDGSIATQVPIAPRALAVGRDGSVFIALSQIIIRVGPDGRTSSLGSVSNTVSDLAVGPQGALYVADKSFVYRIGTGVGAVIGGSSGFTPLVDGQPATSGFMSSPTMLAVAPDGTVLVSEVGGSTPRIRAIDTKGIATTLIGNGKFPNFGPPPQGAFARSTPIGPWGVAVSPDGSVYIIDQQLNNLVRRAAGVFPPIRRGATVVPSVDGTAAYVFDNGRHTSTVDTLTGTTLLNFAYDANGFLTTLTDLDGNVTTIERLGDGTPTGIVAPGGHRTSLAMTDGRLGGVVNPAGEPITLGYNGAGLLADYHDARAGLHHFTYDAKGLVARDDAPDGSSLVLSRSGAGQNYTVTRATAEGRVHTYNVELAGNNAASREHVSPDGTSVNTTFAGASTTTLRSDGTTQGMTEAPDGRFGMTSPLIGSGSVQSTGKLTATSSSRTEVKDPTNPLALSARTQTFDLNGRRWTTAYDGTNRSVRTTTPTGRSVTSFLNASGRLISANQPGFAGLSFGYTSSGLLATVDHGPRRIALDYDAKQQLRTLTDALNRSTTFEYDAASRITRQTLPDGRSMSFGYDGNGNLTTVTPPSRPPHHFTFTAADLMETYTPPASNSTRYTYNRDRQLTALLRPNGATVSFAYDTYGRLSNLGFDRGSYTFTYDSATGQVRSLVAPDVTLSYAYTGPLLTNVVWTGAVNASVGFDYDNNLRLVSDVVGGVSNSYTYDPDGFLTSAGALTIQRDSQNGSLLGTTLTSVSDVYTYNDYAEPLIYTAVVGSNTIFSQQFIRDNDGRITRKTETIDGASHSFDYFYDLAGRLTDVIQDTSVTTSYRYDANGNRLTKLFNGNLVETGTYDDDDRATAYADSIVHFDAAGTLASRTTAAGATTYTYDDLGNLTDVLLVGGARITYVIDGQNRRVARQLNGTTLQRWVYSDQQRIVAEFDGTGALVSRFVYASRSNVPDYMIRNGTLYRIIADQIGSPRLVVEASSGAVAQRIDYDEFGNVLSDSTPAFQPFGFAGGLYDPATNLIRFGIRDYDPSMGRWTAKDPALFAATSPNLYEYASSDPVNNFDPNGLDTVTSDPHNLERMYHLFEKSGFGHRETERAGMITQNNGQYGCTAFPWSAAYRKEEWPRGKPLPPGTIAVAHTHPNTAGQEPSAGDQATASRIHLPIYTITRTGIYKYDPVTRTITKEEDSQWVNRAQQARTAHQSANPAQQSCGCPQ